MGRKIGNEIFLPKDGNHRDHRMELRQWSFQAYDCHLDSSLDLLHEVVLLASCLDGLGCLRPC